MVVRLTPVGEAVPLVALPVELPLAGGNAVAVVMNVVPLESVVVIATPPETNPPIVEVALRPALSVLTATRTLAVLTGGPVFVIVTGRVVTLRVVTEASLSSPVVVAVTVAVRMMLPAEIWASASIDMISQPWLLSRHTIALTSTKLRAHIENGLLVCVARAGFICAVTDTIPKVFV